MFQLSNPKSEGVNVRFSISRGFGLSIALLAVLLAAGVLLLALRQEASADDSTTPPQRPRGLSVSTIAGSLDVSVDWDDTSRVTHYSVRWRLQGPGNPLNEGVEVQSSSATIAVADYGRWVVRVEACNSAGCSPGNSQAFAVSPAPTLTPEPTPAPEPTATPDAPSPVISIPGRPAGLSASTIAGSLDVSVDWDDTPGATSYSVRWRLSGAGNDLNEGMSAASSSASITVADYGEWVVRVEACNSAGCGLGTAQKFTATPVPTATPTPAPSATATATPQPTATSTPAVSVPTRPTGLDVSTEQGSLNVSVDWDDVDEATSYSVRWRLSGAGNDLNEGIIVASSSASITIADYGKWVVRVEACNSAGCSPGKAQAFEIESSDSTSVVTVSPVQRTAPPEPRSLVSKQSTRSGVTLTWTAPTDNGGSAITGYKITRTFWDKSALETVVVVLAENTASTDTSYTDTTAEGLTSYTYYVSAINSEGVGSYAHTYIRTKPKEPIPLAPQDLEATEDTRGEVALTWTAPDDDGGFAITGYKITRRHRDGSPPKSVVVVLAEDTENTDTSYTDTTVAAITSYTYLVSAINSKGVGLLAIEYIVTKPQNAVPLSPQDLEATEDTRGEVALTWTAPTDDGGFAITGYKIARTYWDKSNLETVVVVLAEDTESTDTSYTDTTVDELTKYTYYVRAINSEGVGTYKHKHVLTKPQEPIPAWPRDLVATEDTRGEVTLTWTAPDDDGGHAITGYKIIRTYWDESALETVVVVLAADTASTDTSYTDTTVEAETSYTYHVSAINSEGVGVATHDYITTKPTESVPSPPGDLDSEN